MNPGRSLQRCGGCHERRGGAKPEMFTRQSRQKLPLKPEPDAGKFQAAAPVVGDAASALAGSAADAASSLGHDMETIWGLLLGRPHEN